MIKRSRLQQTHQATQSKLFAMPSDGQDAAPPYAPIAQVTISRIVVRRFRCLEELSLDLQPTTTYLVGENNTGKTSFLIATSAALGRHRATIDDLYRAVDGTISRQAEVDLIIQPSVGAVFGDYERGAFGANIYRTDDRSAEFAGIRTEFTESREGGQLLVRRSFLQPGREGLVRSPSEFLRSALSIFECELLDASRDLIEDIGSRSSKWGRVLFDLQIPELPEHEGTPHPLSRSALEAAMQSLAMDMRKASPVLGQLEADLRRLSHVQHTVGDVTLLPFPPHIEDVMRSVEVVLSQEGTPKLPLRLHGMGSRSLAALFVFATLCALRVGADSALRPHFLTLVEEPEAHLHPQAITALRTELDLLPGQRIISTHSTDLVCDAPPDALRVLRKKGGKVDIFYLSPATLADTARFRRFVERPFGEFFFSRLVVFGDGAAERDALPVLLRAALGVSPAALGVTIVDCQSMNNPQVPKLIDAANDLGLPWILFVDNDSKGVEAVGKVVDPTSGTPLSITSNQVVVAGTNAIERLLLAAGYGPEITEIADAHGEAAASDHDRLHFLKRHKGWAGEAVASLAISRGKAVPSSVTDLASKIQVILGLAPEGGASREAERA